MDNEFIDVTLPSMALRKSSFRKIHSMPELRTKYTDGKSSKGDGKTNKCDGKTKEGDDNTKEGDGKTKEGDGKTKEGDGKTKEGDGKTKEGDGKTKEGDGKTNKCDGKAKKGDGKAIKDDGVINIGETSTNNFATNITSTPSPSTSRESPEVPKHTISSRHEDHILSAAKREDIIIEEMKKFKFKATPVNKMVFKPPRKAVEKIKKITIAEPFNLTEQPKKVSEYSVTKTHKFHARPVPVYIYQPTGVVKLPTEPRITVPQSPSFMRRSQLPPKTSPKRSQPPRKTSPVPNKNETTQKFQPILTVPVPFSFEKRDADAKTRKEKLIESLFEAERKARQFLANPIPRGVLDGSRKLPSSTKTKSHKSMNTVRFKAKPASLRHKKPSEFVLREIMKQGTEKKDMAKKEEEQSILRCSSKGGENKENIQ